MSPRGVRGSRSPVLFVRSIFPGDTRERLSLPHSLGMYGNTVSTDGEYLNPVSVYYAVMGVFIRYPQPFLACLSVSLSVHYTTLATCDCVTHANVCNRNAYCCMYGVAYDSVPPGWLGRNPKSLERAERGGRTVREGGEDEAPRLDPTGTYMSAV